MEFDAKLEVVQIALALEPVSVLISHVHPLDEEGLFLNLPVPSSHDCEIACTCIMWFACSALCSVENTSKHTLTFVVFTSLAAPVN